MPPDRVYQGNDRKTLTIEENQRAEITANAGLYAVRGKKYQVCVKGTENTVLCEGDSGVLRVSGKFHRLKVLGDRCKVKLTEFGHRLVMAGYSNVGEIQGSKHHVTVRGCLPAVRLRGRGHTVIVEGEARCQGVIVLRANGCRLFLPRDHKIKVDDFGHGNIITEVMVKHTEKSKASVNLAGTPVFVSTAPSLSMTDVKLFGMAKFTEHREAEEARIAASRPPGYFSILRNKPRK